MSARDQTPASWLANILGLQHTLTTQDDGTLKLQSFEVRAEFARVHVTARYIQIRPCPGADGGDSVIKRFELRESAISGEGNT